MQEDTPYELFSSVTCVLPSEFQSGGKVIA
jgi:hypothetical protein